MVCGSVEGQEVSTLFVHHLQYTTATTSDAGQWVIGNDDRDTGLFHQQTVQVTQQGSAAREDNAPASFLLRGFREIDDGP